MQARSDRGQKRVEELHQLLVESVEAVQSAVDWRRILDFAARFHHYSFDNQMLIAVQHHQAYKAGRVSTPQPGCVAGFHTWKAVGRSVNKGQRGYAILAPVLYPTRSAHGTGDAARPPGRGEVLAEGEELLRGQRILRGFTVAHVWDVSQTCGAPIPEPPRPKLLRGGAPEGLAEQLTAYLNARGFGVAYVADADVIGGANGLTDFAAHIVSVRANMQPAARVKTLAHETGHVLLHNPSAGGEATALGVGHRGRAEVEAESVAYVLTAAHGIDSSGYSLPYVTSWAGTDKPAEVVRQTARRVVGAAHEVLESLQADVSSGQPPGIARAPQWGHAQRPIPSGLGLVSEAIGL